MGSIVCRKVVGTRSSGHVVRWVHVKSLDISLSVRGINVEKEGGTLRACSRTAVHWIRGHLKELTVDSYNFFYEQLLCSSDAGKGGQ